MIALYLGLPGDGKSMSGMRRLVATLSETTRYVITNLPVELGELESYLWKVYGNTFECRRRVVLLEQDQVRKFWLVRADGWRMLDIPEESYARNCFPSLQCVYRWRAVTGSVRRDDLSTLGESDVLRLVEAGEVEVGDVGALGLSADYLIDEAQNFWPARSFQTTPKGLLFYLSQHRHVGDNCVFITQKEGQVEKTIRNLVMEFWVFRNMGQRKRLGFWLPGVFGYTCFPESPSALGAQYSAIGTFRMDVNGLAPCYRTADGVGVGGPTMVADTGRKRRGWTWRTAVLIGAIIVFAIVLAPGALTKLLSHVFLSMHDKTNFKGLPAGTNVARYDVVTNSPSQPSASVVPAFRFPEPKIIIRKERERFSTNDAIIAGAFRGRDGWFVTLRDGRNLNPGDYWKAHEFSGELSWVELEQNGQRASWISKPSEDAAPQGRHPASLVPYK